MRPAVDPLRPEAIEQLAGIVGQVCSGTQITELFRRSGFAQVVHDGSTKWRFVASELERLQSEDANRPHRIIRVLETLCSPQAYVGRREQFDSLLAAVNQVLAFYGLTITEEGKAVIGGEKARTVRTTVGDDEMSFLARNFHSEVGRHGRRHFSRGAYFHAVFECCKALNVAVENNTGIEKSGQALMSAALGVDGPLALNRRLTQSERDEQQGVMFLCMGLMNAIRNPQAHEPELSWPMTREDALDVLTLISFLFRKLERGVIVGSSGGTPFAF